MASSQEYYEEDDTTDDEEEEEDEDEEETTKITPVQPTRIGKGKLKSCQGTRVGDTNEFHDRVKFKTVWKITSTQTHSPNPCAGQITCSQPLQYAVEGISESPEGNYTVNEVVDQSSGDAEDVESNPTSHATEETERIDNGSEETALLGDNGGGNKSKIKSALCFGAALLFLLSIVGTLIAALVLHFTLYPDDVDNLPFNFTERLVTRGEWFALQPKIELKPFQYKPVPFLVVSHTAGRSCLTKRYCRVMVREIQAGQMAGKFNDISYSFLVGGDGYIYEGRGWDDASAGITIMDCSSLSIGFIGNFIVDEPPLKQLNAFRLVIKAGIEKGKLDENFKMFMQKQIMSTESPGEALIEILRNWPHWKPFSKEDLLCNNSTKG